jgi:hypothetical protein
MIKKKPGGKKDLVSVSFELPSSMWAERVNPVGDFDD